MKLQAKQLSDSIIAWISLLPSWELTKRAMALNYRLMLMYGRFTEKEGFVDEANLHQV